jgi:hypothetical protein
MLLRSELARPSCQEKMQTHQTVPIFGYQLRAWLLLVLRAALTSVKFKSPLV